MASQLPNLALFFWPALACKGIIARDSLTGSRTTGTGDGRTLRKLVKTSSLPATHRVKRIKADRVPDGQSARTLDINDPGNLCRGVAQPGRALPSGGRGRKFKSSHPDQVFHYIQQYIDLRPNRSPRMAHGDTYGTQAPFIHYPGNYPLPYGGAHCFPKAGTTCTYLLCFNDL
jgi:hypothetical protein